MKCLNFGDHIFSKIAYLFKDDQLFDFYETVEGSWKPREDKKAYKFPKIVHFMFKKNKFLKYVQPELVRFTSHLAELYWTTSQMKILLDPKNPQLPEQDLFIGFDFSQSPSFMKAKMNQQHYQKN